MRNTQNKIITFLLAITIIMPHLAFGAVNPGIKPGSWFYFLDTFSEKVGLFFTFNSENKARKALEYADERLAEIEIVAEAGDSTVIQKAITNYGKNILLATESSKAVKDARRAGELFNLITEDAVRHQEVLSGIYAKASDEAKSIIGGAIDASKIGQEEARKQTGQISDGKKLPESAFEKRLESDSEYNSVYERLNPEDKIRAQNIRIENRPISPLQELPSSVFPIFEPPATDLVLPKCLSSGAVCGINGQTYVNSCIPEQVKIAIVHMGPCVTE